MRNIALVTCSILFILSGCKGQFGEVVGINGSQTCRENSTHHQFSEDKSDEDDPVMLVETRLLTLHQPVACGGWETIRVSTDVVSADANASFRLRFTSNDAPSYTTDHLERDGGLWKADIPLDELKPNVRYTIIAHDIQGDITFSTPSEPGEVVVRYKHHY